VSPFAQNLSDTDMADLTGYYEAQRPRQRPAKTDPAKVAAGRQLAGLHHCTSCHKPRLTGQQQVPRLAGQDFDYLHRLLRGFKAQTASDLDGAMTMAAQPSRRKTCSTSCTSWRAWAASSQLGERAVAVPSYFPRSFGSSASRNESPKRLKPNTPRLIAMPGNRAIHGAFSAYDAAEPESISPHDGVGSAAPRPK